MKFGSLTCRILNVRRFDTVGLLFLNNGFHYTICPGSGVHYKPLYNFYEDDFMKRNKRILFLLGILIVITLACTLPVAQPAVAPPVDSVNIVATQTSLALTQATGQIQPAVEQPAIIPATATLTPSITPTLAPSIPMVSVSVDSNCRFGPGPPYDYLTGLLVGEKAEVVGKYTATNPVYWIIKKGGITCWLWGEYATVEGDTSNLPEMTPPPSPTPPPSDTPTPTATTPPPVTGDLHIKEIFMKANREVGVHVGINPTGSLSGNYHYLVISNGSTVKEGNCTISPTPSHNCYTGYIVGGLETIQVVIDSNSTITESNETNNVMTVICDKLFLTCN